MKNISSIESLKASRSWSFVVIAVIYLIAAVSGIWTFIVLDDMAVLLRLFVADFVATVFVWLWGVIFRNSSVYDPYWSVAPPLMLTGYAVHCGAFALPVILMLIAVWYWAIRLTGNWAYTFPNLNKQDWRYDMYKEKFPLLWHIVNFTGINLMPTVVVFLAMVPGFLLIGTSVVPVQANLWTWLGFIVCISAATLQLISDHSWEVVLLPAVGALANTCLFVFISIPMMEKRQLANKPGYADYRKRVRMLI